jgi:hypothetical protein
VSGDQRNPCRQIRHRRDIKTSKLAITITVVRANGSDSKTLAKNVSCRVRRRSTCDSRKCVPRFASDTPHTRRRRRHGPYNQLCVARTPTVRRVGIRHQFITLHVPPIATAHVFRSRHRRQRPARCDTPLRAESRGHQHRHDPDLPVRRLRERCAACLNNRPDACTAGDRCR